MLSGKQLIIREEVKDLLKEIEAFYRRINPFIGQSQE
jgi:uncharacterized protein YlzI (FlbEa/FlbD family)